MVDDVDGHAISQTAHHLITTSLNVQSVLLLHFGLLDLANLVFVAAGKAFAHHLAANADGDVLIVECAKPPTQISCDLTLDDLGQTGRFLWIILVILDVLTAFHSKYFLL